MRDADTLHALADQCEQAWPGMPMDRVDLFGIFRAAWPRQAFATGRESDAARSEFFDLWERGAQIDAATRIAPPGCMYRSGHDGTGPDPSRFFCDAVTDAPDCRRVRAVADTEALARVAAFLRAHIPMEGEGVHHA